MDAEMLAAASRVGIYESIKKDAWESMMYEIINVRAGNGKLL